MLDDTIEGEVLDCPLHVKGAWQMVGTSDISLAQATYLITRGNL